MPNHAYARLCACCAPAGEGGKSIISPMARGCVLTKSCCSLIIAPFMQAFGGFVSEVFDFAHRFVRRPAYAAARDLWKRPWLFGGKLDACVRPQHVRARGSRQPLTHALWRSVIPDFRVPVPLSAMEKAKTPRAHPKVFARTKAGEAASILRPRTMRDFERARPLRTYNA